MRSFALSTRYLRNLSALLAAACLVACSLAPDIPVTKESLAQVKLFERFVIEENPETIAFALNKEGETVVRAMFRNQPVYIKIFATSKGIIYYVYPRER